MHGYWPLARPFVHRPRWQQLHAEFLHENACTCFTACLNMSLPATVYEVVSPFLPCSCCVAQPGLTEAFWLASPQPFFLCCLLNVRFEALGGCHRGFAEHFVSESHLQFFSFYIEYPVHPMSPPMGVGDYLYEVRSVQGFT